MKTTLSLLTLAMTAAHAKSELIYDHRERNSRDAFSLYLEKKEDVAKRPQFEFTPEGIVGKPGDGNFTVWKFADLRREKGIERSWNLKIRLRIPDTRYVNSGVYLMYADPEKPLGEIPEAQRPAFAEAHRLAEARKVAYKAGPFEVDYFGHELQIISGTDWTVPPDNRGAAAFYGVEIGQSEGQQVKPNEYDLCPGRRYEITIQTRDLVTETFVEALTREAPTVKNPWPHPESCRRESPKGRLLVSRFTNVTEAKDPVRGGSPTGLLLQAFYNNGEEAEQPYRLPVFERIELERLTAEEK